MGSALEVNRQAFLRVASVIGRSHQENSIFQSTPGHFGVGLSAVPYTGTVVLITGRKEYNTDKPVPYSRGTRGATVRVRRKYGWLRYIQSFF
jgi:hypothetical protein